VKIHRKNTTRKEISIEYGNDNSININIFNNEVLKEVVGSFDNNLKELEKNSGSKIYFRGNSIIIKGNKDKNEKVKDAIEYLIDRFKSDKKIDKNDIITSLNKEMIKIRKINLLCSL
jgi:phosphate starvation-inducible PhoH-like protein